MFDPSILVEYGVASFATGCIVGVCRWFLAALDKKDKLIGTIVAHLIT